MAGYVFYTTAKISSLACTPGTKNTGSLHLTCRHKKLFYTTSWKLWDKKSSSATILSTCTTEFTMKTRKGSASLSKTVAGGLRVTAWEVKSGLGASSISTASVRILAVQFASKYTKTDSMWYQIGDPSTKKKWISYPHICAGDFRLVNLRAWKKRRCGDGTMKGPIDNSQTSLQLNKDEATGEIKIVEVRREWCHGFSETRRTSFTTIFPSDSHIRESSLVDNTPRLPRNVHTYTSGGHWKPSFQYYHSTSSTFCDLMQEPATHQVHIRFQSRQLNPPEAENLSDTFTSSETIFWTPAQGFNASDIDPLSILNPKAHLDIVAGTADERSLVYISGTRGKLKAIVLISFDPAITLTIDPPGTFEGRMDSGWLWEERPMHRDINMSLNFGIPRTFF
jgi:hypothetical protein